MISKRTCPETYSKEQTYQKQPGPTNKLPGTAPWASSKCYKPPITWSLCAIDSRNEGCVTGACTTLGADLATRGPMTSSNLAVRVVDITHAFATNGGLDYGGRTVRYTHTNVPVFRGSIPNRAGTKQGFSRPVHVS